jgi:hypothetical protein
LPFIELSGQCGIFSYFIPSIVGLPVSIGSRLEWLKRCVYSSIERSPRVHRSGKEKEKLATLLPWRPPTSLRPKEVGGRMEEQVDALFSPRRLTA